MYLYLLLNFIKDSVKSMKADIETLNLYKNKKMSKTLDHLNSEIMMLEKYIDHFSASNQLKTGDIPGPDKSAFSRQAQPAAADGNAPGSADGARTFTLEELAKYDGKNGNPAYVAVNGVVYDVTNVPAWAAATHFGFNAGNDLTVWFMSCHAAAYILKNLPVAGILV